jgi:hypothetical protein
MFDTHGVGRSANLASQVEVLLEPWSLKDRSNCHPQFPRPLIKLQFFEGFGNHADPGCTSYSSPLKMVTDACRL